MRNHCLLTSALLLGTLGLFSPVPAPDAMAADPQVRGTSTVVPAEEPAASKESSAVRKSDGVASGAVEDTLKACLARIPSQATAGQRMLAEQGCQGEQKTRTSSHASPQF